MRTGHLKLELTDQAAGYIKAGEKATQVVQGSAHEAPSFFGSSALALEDLAGWIGRRADGVAPWVARIHLNGPNLPKGSWEILSSEAGGHRRRWPLGRAPRPS